MRSWSGVDEWMGRENERLVIVIRRSYGREGAGGVESVCR
jgi:hypothetical protein